MVKEFKAKKASMFQFLIGRLKLEAIFMTLTFKSKFQFLIGRLKRGSVMLELIQFI